MVERRPRLYLGEGVFRKVSNDPGSDALRFVRLSDSTFIPIEELVVYEGKRLTKNTPSHSHAHRRYSP